MVSSTLEEFCLMSVLKVSLEKSRFVSFAQVSESTKARLEECNQNWIRFNLG